MTNEEFIGLKLVASREAPPALTFRAIAPDDWEKLKMLRLTAYDTDASAFKTSFRDAEARPDEEWEKEVGAALAHDAHSVIIVGENPDGELVACASADESPDEPGVWKINNVYVHKKHRGEAGDKLLEALLDTLTREKHARRADLVVNQKAKGAIDLYEQFRFRVTGVQGNRYSGDGNIHNKFTMSKDLGAEAIPAVVEEEQAKAA